MFSDRHLDTRRLYNFYGKIVGIIRSEDKGRGSGLLLSGGPEVFTVFQSAV